MNAKHIMAAVQIASFVVAIFAIVIGMNALNSDVRVASDTSAWAFMFTLLCLPFAIYYAVRKPKKS